MANDPQLRRWYNKFNARFFAGKLPFNACLYWESPNGQIGDCTAIEPSEGEFVIRIDPAIRWSAVLAKLTLLHEMTHLKLHPYEGHGKKFDEEIQRLCTFREYRKLL